MTKVNIKSMIYNILHVSLYKWMGGTENAFFHYSEAMSKFANVINVIHPKYKYKNKLCNYINLNTKLKSITKILHIRKLIKIHKPHVIVAHGTSGINMVKIASLGLDVKIIGVRHSFFSSKLSEMIWHMKTDATIGVNSEIANSNKYKNSFLVYNAVPGKSIERTKIFDEKNVKIGFLGRLVEKKGVHFIIKAPGILNNKGDTNFEVVIGGTGKYLNVLKKLTTMHDLNDKVHFLGQVDNKSEFFNKIDILCLPSLKEAFGLVLIEAMAHGVPVIASDIPGIRELIVNGENGLLFTPESHHDIAEKVRKIVFNKDLREKLITGGFECWRDNYQINRLSADLHKVISYVYQKSGFFEHIRATENISTAE